MIGIELFIGVWRGLFLVENMTISDGTVYWNLPSLFKWNSDWNFIGTWGGIYWVNENMGISYRNVC